MTSQLNSEALWKLSRQLVPALTSTKHKGQAGKIGIIGGCFEYTGAPYYASYSPYKIGADLSHVFCSQGAAIPIKCYSPEIIVHPVLYEKQDYRDPNPQNPEKPENLWKSAAQNVIKWFPALQGIVIGPGLGRDQWVIESVQIIIEEAKKRNMPLVVDGDGLWIVQQNPDMIRNYSNCVITPNVAEYGRLVEFLQIGKDVELDQGVMILSQKLGVTVCQKNQIDRISNGKTLIYNEEEGSPRRCGGQGDVLAGSMGLFLLWASQTKLELPETVNANMIAAWSACTLVRKCAAKGFAKHHRSMTTPNLMEELGGVFHANWDSQEGK